MSDKAGGTFQAQRGIGYIEMTSFNYLLEKKSGKKLTVTLGIKSNNPVQVREGFLAVYSKYVKIAS